MDKFALAKLDDSHGVPVWTWLVLYKDELPLGTPSAQVPVFTRGTIEDLQDAAEARRMRPFVVVPESEIDAFKGVDVPKMFAFAVCPPTRERVWVWIQPPNKYNPSQIVESTPPEEVALYTEDKIEQIRVKTNLSSLNVGKKVDLAIVPSYEVATFRDTIKGLNKI